MTFCAKCGKELPAGATFCPSCGAPVEAAAGASTSATGTTSTAAPLSGIDALTKDAGAQQYWFKRLIALFIDGLIVFIPLIILTVIVSIFVALGGIFTPALFIGGTLSVFWSLLFVLYFTFTESMWGASFGKQFMHLKVVGRSGGHANVGEAFIRNISKIYWLLLLLDVIIGLALSKGYQQKYTDQFAGTKVLPA